MEIGVAEARRRFKEVLDRVEAGEVVRVKRRDRVVVVMIPPIAHGVAGSFDEVLSAWRKAWSVDSWPDDDPFADVRDRTPGRVVPR